MHDNHVIIVIIIIFRRDAGGQKNLTQRPRFFLQPDFLLSSPRQPQQLRVKVARYKDMETPSPSYLRPKLKRSHHPLSTSSSMSFDSSYSEDEIQPLPCSILRHQVTSGKRLLRVTFGPTSTICTEITPSTSNSNMLPILPHHTPCIVKKAVLQGQLNLKCPPQPKRAPLATPEDSLSPPESPQDSPPP